MSVYDHQRAVRTLTAILAAAVAVSIIPVSYTHLTLPTTPYV